MGYNVEKPYVTMLDMDVEQRVFIKEDNTIREVEVRGFRTAPYDNGNCARVVQYLLYYGKKHGSLWKDVHAIGHFYNSVEDAVDGDWIPTTEVEYKKFNQAFLKDKNFFYNDVDGCIGEAQSGEVSGWIWSNNSPKRYRYIDKDDVWANGIEFVYDSCGSLVKPICIRADIYGTVSEVKHLKGEYKKYFATLDECKTKCMPKVIYIKDDM